MEEKYFIIEWSIKDPKCYLILCDILEQMDCKFSISLNSDSVMSIKKVSKDEFLNYNYG